MAGPVSKTRLAHVRSSIFSSAGASPRVRAALYFYAVYRSAADDTFFEGMREELVQWAEADPPTDAEGDRSSQIAARQGNENPFVLDTTLADRAFSEGGGEDPPPEGTPSSEALFISELSDAEEDFTTEFFEIYNDSTSAVDLAGTDGKIIQDLRNGDQVYTFDFGDDETDACESTTVPAKGALVVPRGAVKADFEAEWGALPTEAGYCAFNQNSFFPGTDERSWELRVGGTPGDPDGKILGETPQFDNMEGSRAFQDLSLGSPWQQQEPISAVTPGTLDEGQVLPVELASFEGTSAEGAVRLTWQTASETGSAGFDVQRREVGASGQAQSSSWTTVGFVKSKARGGTTSEPKSYRFANTDLPYDAGRLSYRLRQVDTGDGAALSDPVMVERGAGAAEFLPAFPNPATRQATIRYMLPEKQSVEIRLYDALGRKVRTVVDAKKEGRHEETIDVSGLPSGTYFLWLRAKGMVESRQVTVLR
jgi:hypothetical protein